MNLGVSPPPPPAGRVNLIKKVLIGWAASGGGEKTGTPTETNGSRGTADSGFMMSSGQHVFTAVNPP